MAQAETGKARRHLSAGFSQAQWRNPELRKLVYFIMIATGANIAIASQLTYGAVNYMDSVTFCARPATA